MRSGHIPHEEPKIGDWCIEKTSFKVDNDHCVGKLIKVYGEEDYEIQTVGGKIVRWSNSEFSKIPGKCMRKE